MLGRAYTPFLTKREVELPFYVATIGNPNFQTSTQRPKGIPDYQLLYTVKGEGKCYIYGHEYSIKKGDILFHPPYVEHDYFAAEGNWESMYITFGGSGVKDFFNYSMTLWTDLHDFDFLKHYEKLYRLKKENAYTELSVELYRSLIELKEQVFFLENGTQRSRDKVELALKMIRENPAITVATLSEKLHISKEHFCRIFKAYMGYRPTEYMNNLKLEYAKNLLTNLDYTINQVAQMVGYKDISYFGKMFKQTFGCTPGEYREQ